MDKLLLKELVDNALDACEVDSEVHVILLKHDNGFMTLRVRDNGKGMDKKNLERMTDLDNLYSSKFYYKVPSRGALGNGMKCIIGLPYALGREHNVTLPEPHITIQSLGLKHQITMKIDQQTEKTRFLIDSSSDEIGAKGFWFSVDLYRHKENWGYKTEYADLISAYAIFNPNASLRLLVEHDFSLNRNFSSINKDFKRFEGTSSIYWYSPNSFKELIEAFIRSTQLGERNYTLREFIKKFRGFTSDVKVSEVIKELGNVVIKYVSDLNSDEDLKKLYDSMKQNSDIPTSEVLGKIGKSTLQKRIEQIYGTLREFKYKYYGKVVFGEDHYCPFVLEIALAVLERDTGLKVLVGINHSPTLENPFENIVAPWKDNKGIPHETAIVTPTLEKYGIDKNQNIILIIHLICPNVEYESYGKRKIDTNWFSDSIAKNLTSICKFYPQYKARGHREGRESKASKFLRKELERRKELLDTKRGIPPDEKTTQQGIYYKVRNQMEREGGIDIKRTSFIKALGNLCKEIGGDLAYREKLGITAAERAQLYFRGQVNPISWDKIEDLAARGSDVILIEKEGVCEVLEPYAARRGIALLNSRGFATDYAKQLLQLSQKWRGNIFLLTDFDASGLLIASKVLEGKIPRIGVDLTMVEELGLTRRDLEEKYDTEDTKAPKKHLMGLPIEMRAEVKDKRIEIDAVLAAVGPVKLWNYIEKSILEIAPTRNMNRSVDLAIPLPTEINESILTITSFIQSVGSEKQNEFRRILNDWNGGFIYVDDKENDLKSQIVEEIGKNDIVQELAKQLKSLSEKIPKNS